jgi:hypothetical protein
MADELAVMVVERGLLTVSEEMWALAVRRAGVIGRLAAGDVVGHEAADAGYRASQLRPVKG